MRKGSRLDIAYSLENTDLHWTVDISGLAGDWGRVSGISKHSISRAQQRYRTFPDSTFVNEWTTAINAGRICVTRAMYA